MIFKSHALKCGSVVACVRTVTLFVKVTIISDGQSFSRIYVVYFPSFWGFLSNKTGNPTSKQFLKPDNAFLFSSFLVPSSWFAPSQGIKATKRWSGSSTKISLILWNSGDSLNHLQCFDFFLYKAKINRRKQFCLNTKAANLNLLEIQFLGSGL